MATAVENKETVQSTVDYVITEEEVAGLQPVDASKHPYRIWKEIIDIALAGSGVVEGKYTKQ